MEQDDETIKDNDCINYISKEDAFVHFIQKSQGNILTIPYKIVVPNNFDSQNYYDVSELSKQFKSIDDVALEYIFIHWYHNGQNSDYMSRVNTMGNSLSGISMNVITSKIFDIFSGFNKIHIYHDTDAGLETISRICNENPGLDINKALDNYIKTNVPNLGSVEKILNGELGFADLGVAAEIQTLLKNIGVTMSYGKGPSNDTIQNVKITLSSKKNSRHDSKKISIF